MRTHTFNLGFHQFHPPQQRQTHPCLATSPHLPPADHIKRQTDTSRPRLALLLHVRGPSLSLFTQRMVKKTWNFLVPRHVGQAAGLLVKSRIFLKFPLDLFLKRNRGRDRHLKDPLTKQMRSITRTLISHSMAEPESLRLQHQVMEQAWLLRPRRPHQLLIQELSLISTPSGLALPLNFRCLHLRNRTWRIPVHMVGNGIQLSTLALTLV